MNIDDSLEVRQRHLGEAGVPQDAGVVDQDVDPAPSLNGGLDHMLHLAGVGDVRPVGDRLTARGDDLVGDFLGRRRGMARAVDGAAEIVDDDLRATPGQGQGVRPTKTRRRTGHDGDAAIKSNAQFQSPRAIGPKVADAEQ